MKISVCGDAVFMDAILGIRASLAYRGRLIAAVRAARFASSSTPDDG
jgi:hypothetical protein